jgi:hypothetical protein
MTMDGWLLLIAISLIVLNALLWCPRATAWALLSLTGIAVLILWLIARSGEDDECWRRRCP